MAVNCGALPDQLLESELFGYKSGAFTGAVRDKPGRFALARGGSIFLDEIGEISPALQVRLLRVLQEKVFEPLGSVRSESSDARVIAATNKDLAEMTRRGQFREDLYYRVNVGPVGAAASPGSQGGYTSSGGNVYSAFQSSSAKIHQGIVSRGAVHAYGPFLARKRA